MGHYTTSQTIGSASRSCVPDLARTGASVERSPEQRLAKAVLVAGVVVFVVEIVTAGPRIGAGSIGRVCWVAIGPETTLGNRPFKGEQWYDDCEGAFYHVRMSGFCNTDVR